MEAVQPSPSPSPASEPKKTAPTSKPATSVPSEAAAAVEEVQKGTDQAVEAAPGMLYILHPSSTACLA